MTSIDLAELPLDVAARLRAGAVLTDHGELVGTTVPWDDAGSTAVDRAARLHVFGGLPLAEAAAHEGCGRGAVIANCQRLGWPVLMDIGATHAADDAATLEQIGF